MNYGGVAREGGILQYPCAPASTVVRGMLVEYTGGVIIAWAGTNPLFGVATGDADLDSLVIPVYVVKGDTVFMKCDTAVVPAVGAPLYKSATAGTVGTTISGSIIGYARKVGLNGMVEASVA